MDPKSVAIIGVGCRFPDALSPEAFWQLLCHGVDAVTAPPKDRVAIHYNTIPATTEVDHVSQGGFLSAVDQFDPKFFGISAEEAVVMDPQQRLLLEVTWQALEDAGQVPANLAGSLTGVFVGIASGSYGQLATAVSGANKYYATSQNPSIAANRISFQFNFQGPSLAINTACSSSLVAVHQACQSLILGESTLAVAGGVNLVLSGHETAKLSESGLLSATGRCRSFDASADGYVRSEGVGVIVLKPFEQAQADGDRIYAVIRGSAVNHNGRGNGLTAPNPNAQKVLLHTAYDRAGIRPEQVQYIEAHGSGTVFGDALELKALGEFLATGRSPDNPCAVGCVKTNLGNAELASGIAGLIKVALALKHQQLPPTLHFQQPNPHVPFEQLPINVQTHLSNWPLSPSPGIAGVSAFGLGGTNAHVVLAGVAAQVKPMPVPEPAERSGLFVLSAKSEQALKMLAQNYQRFLVDGSALHLMDVCYTVSVKRSHFAYRLAIVANSIQDLQQQLQHCLSQNPSVFNHKINRRRQRQTPTLVYPLPTLSVSEREIALHTLAQYWLEGIDIDWSQVYDKTSCQFISAPTYPFDRQSYWGSVATSGNSVTTAEDSFSLQIDSDYVEPTNDLQQRIIKLWQTLLGVDIVSIHDNFFELGGDSVLATRLVSRILGEFQIELPIMKVFEAPTVAELAIQITLHSRAPDQSSVKRVEYDQILALLDNLEAMTDEEVKEQLALLKS